MRARSVRAYAGERREAAGGMLLVTEARRLLAGCTERAEVPDEVQVGAAYQADAGHRGDGQHSDVPGGDTRALSRNSEGPKPPVLLPHGGQ